MKETNRVGIKTAAEGEDTTNVLDDSTRDMFEDYSRKFLSFIQQEKDRIRKQALEESEKVLAEADRKGRLAYEKVVKDATTEAEGILSRSRETATRMTAEATRLLKAMADLRDKVDQQMDELGRELREEADTVAEFIRQKDKTFAEAKDRLHKEFETSSALVAELEQALQQIAKPLPQEPARENRPASQPVRAEVKEVREQVVERAAPKEDNPVKRAEKTFVGTLNLDVNKGNPGLSRRFKESLSKIPGLEISLADDTARDRTRIVAFASRPLPLLNILHQMSMVKSVVADDESLKVTLQESDRWIG